MSGDFFPRFFSMKKILLVSDTHLENEIFKQIIVRHKDCDYFVHCGDSSLSSDDPLLQGFIVVHGNHDDDPRFDIDRFFKVENKRVLVTHGHYYHVYDGYDLLYQKAVKMKCQLVFHGHTHIPAITTIGEVQFINPGSVMFNRGTYGYGTYAIVKVDNNNAETHFYHHETHEQVDDIVLPDGQKMLSELRKFNK